MARKPIIVRTVPALRKAIAQLRKRRKTIALVPTMGALHEGHFSLVRHARKRAGAVAVSIFVNPKQFAPTEDFGSYPRNFARDVAALTELGVDLVWAPTDAAMYPDGFSTAVLPDGPAKAGLEDTYRPHFFGGVTTVVAKLFLQVGADVALFGQKDYQQLKVVTRMASDLDIPTKVVGCPTVREKDGLALSSRNVYLSPAERQTAPVLYRVLKDSAARIKAGETIAKILADGRATITNAGFAVDYLEARHAETLEPVATYGDGPIRLLVAARLGKTRLIDNLGV
ncbi:pantoate--beta-alanine ligase [Pseudorhodoplanes sp.]|uniref:pantoate--beta-alanine ligase n=1 Tax=Pseudorhodoplanes sp. TaxID=1934341 RepID=UPI002C3EAF4D|nr:pantoate--beta-alanine ligase [Pseudorhodoplanes sp.]HWV55588.1 pantoate--beta-alanine ligase [Pseudorhodoplanes sp.]